MESPEYFAPAVGSLFRVVSPGPVDELELIELVRAPPRDEADARRRAAAGIRADPFTLLFRGSPGARLGQGIHRLESDLLGAVDIFLVPIHPDARGPLYEAVFN